MTDSGHIAHRRAGPRPSDTGSTWKTWLVVLTLAMLFGVMEAAQLRLGSSVLGQGMPISVALARVMPFWLLAAIVVPLIVLAGRRFRVWQFLLRPNVPAVAVTATGFAVLALAGPRPDWHRRSGKRGRSAADAAAAVSNLLCARPAHLHGVRRHALRVSLLPRGAAPRDHRRRSCRPASPKRGSMVSRRESIPTSSSPR